MMKRLILTLMILTIVIAAVPMTSEARNREVTITSATVTSSGATVSGTTDAPAVMVQIRDTDDNVLSMASFAVVDGTFSGTVSQSLSESVTYKVYVADYEGGPFSVEEGVVPVSPAAPSTRTSYDNSTSTPAVVTEERIYTVVKGDNLRKIAKKLGVSLKDLTTWNSFRNINLIYPGQKIIYYVSAAKNEADSDGTEGIYVVERGDNLIKIARKLKLSLAHILSKNTFKNIHLIYPGQKIKY